MNTLRSVILIILDGWGIGADDFSNPIRLVNPPIMNSLKKRYPYGTLQASGITVGLPWGEEGNSEVGHLNIGAGRILYQNFPRITLSIKDGSFYENEILKKTLEYAKSNNSSLNLIGLLSDACVHSSFEHLLALLEAAKKNDFPLEKINLHLITDGRDSSPESAVEFINKIPEPFLKQIASLGGRYYAMDRDSHWDRTQKYYNAITGQGGTIDDYQMHIKSTYSRKLNDEYIPPTLIGPQDRSIKNNDAVIFFNFREDRMRQIVRCFIEKDFNHFPIKQFSNLFVTTMVSYKDEFTAPVLFPAEKVLTPLGKVLEENNKIQWRIAETEKYAHVTYFFNGQEESPFKGEYRVLVPSKISFRYDQHPEMMAGEITSRLLEAIKEKVYDFILVNFANPDIIAHTGNFEATAEAIRVIDAQIEKIYASAIENNSFLIITSDHGNAERLIDPKTGTPETKHDPNPVPFYLIAKEFERQNTDQYVHQAEHSQVGVLADVAPTILELMKIPKPPEMTGHSLIKLIL
ncbi:MAG: 2,3-bisphosphoglycerate-independent phosphoglycerate mutase [Patescibacteria group bacterium]